MASPLQGRVGLRGRFDELLSISAAEISIDNCNKSFQTFVRARNVLVGAHEVLFGARELLFGALGRPSRSWGVWFYFFPREF